MAARGAAGRPSRRQQIIVFPSLPGRRGLRVTAQAGMVLVHAGGAIARETLLSQIFRWVRFSFIAAAPIIVAGCTSGPFSYAEDRCVGGYNQCQTQCLGTEDPGARASCQSRCLASEDRCYTTGPDGTGSSISQDALIGSKLSEREKQAEYERWRAQRARERAASGESDVDIETVE